LYRSLFFHVLKKEEENSAKSRGVLNLYCVQNC